MATNTRLDTNFALNSGSAWSSGAAPATTDQLYWNGVSASNAQTLMGAAINVGGTGGGVRVGASQTNPVTINAATAVALTLGTLGIDLSTASADLTIGSTNTVALTIVGTPLNIATGRTVTIRSIISGTGFGFSKTGAGEVIFTAANTYTGLLVGSAGTITASTVAGALGAGTLQFDATNPVTLNLRASVADAGLAFGRNTAFTGASSISLISDRLTASGAGVTHTLGTLTQNATGPISLTAGPLVTSGTAGLTFGATTLNAATAFSLGANTQLTLAAVTGNGFVITTSGSGNLTLTGIFSGVNSGLTLAAGYTGTVTVSAINTYTGPTTINSGTLKALTSASALGTSSVVLNGGTLYFGGTAALAYNRPISVTASSTMTAARTTSGVGVAYTFGAVTLGAGVTLNVTSDSTNVTTGTLGVTYGAVALSGAATISAFTDTTSAAYTLVATFGAVSGEYALNISGGSSGNDGIVVLGTASTRSTLAGTTSLDSTAHLRVTVANGLSTLAAAPLSLSSGATLTLALAANTTFAGTAITVDAGVQGRLLVLDRTAAGAAANYSYTIHSLTFVDGAKLTVDLGSNYTSVWTATLVAPTLTLAGAATLEFAGDGINTSTFAYAVPAVVVPSGKKFLISTIAGAIATLTQTGAISGDGSVEYNSVSRIDGEPRITLSQTNSYQGGTRLGVATVNVANASAFSTGALEFVSALNGSAGYVNFNNNTAGPIAISNSLNFDSSSNKSLSLGGTSLLTLTGSVYLGNTVTLLGSSGGANHVLAGNITGPGGLNFSFINGSLTLTGNNSFEGNIQLDGLSSSYNLYFNKTAIPSTAAITTDSSGISGIYYSDSGDYTLTNPITVNGSTSFNVHATGGRLTLSGALSASSTSAGAYFNSDIILLGSGANFKGIFTSNSAASILTIGSTEVVNNPASLSLIRIAVPRLRSTVSLTLGANNGIAGAYYAGSGTSRISAATGTTLTIEGPLTNVSSPFIFGEADYLGDVVLRGSNQSYQLAITVTAGMTLVLESPGAIGTSAALGSVTINGTLSIKSGLEFNGRPFILTSGGVLAFDNAASSYLILYSGGITLSGNATISGANFAQTSGTWGPTGSSSSPLLGANTLTVLLPTSVASYATGISLPGMAGTGGSLQVGTSSSGAGYGRLTIASATYTGTTAVYAGVLAFTGTAPSTSVVYTYKTTGGGIAPRYGIFEGGTGLSYTSAASALQKLSSLSTGFVGTNAASSLSLNLSTFTGLGLFGTATGSITYSGTVTPATNGYLFGSYSQVTLSQGAPQGGIGFTISSALTSAKTLTIAGPGIVRLTSVSNTAITSVVIDHGVLNAATWNTTTGTGTVTVTANTPFAAMWHDANVAETVTRTFVINGNFTIGVWGTLVPKSALTLSGTAVIAAGVNLRFTGFRSDAVPAASMTKWTGLIGGDGGIVIGTGSVVWLTHPANAFTGTVSYDTITSGGNGGSLRSDYFLPRAVSLMSTSNYFYVADGGEYNTVATTIGTANQYVTSGSTGTLAFFADSNENINLSTLGGGAYTNLRFGTTDQRTVTYGGVLTQSAAGVAHKFSVGANSTLVLSNVLSGSGGLHKDDSGALRFSLLPTYTGPTVIRRGSVEYNEPSVLPAVLDTTGSSGQTTAFVRLLGNGTSYNMSGHTLVDVAVVASGSTYSIVAAPTAPVSNVAFAAGPSGRDLTVTGDITVVDNQALYLRNQKSVTLFANTGTDPTASLIIGGAISGSNISVIKNNFVGLTGMGAAAGTTFLLATSTYSGTTQIGYLALNAPAAGAMRVQASGAFGTSTVAVYASDTNSAGYGCSVELAGGVTLDNAFTVSGYGIGSAGVIRSVSGVNTLSGSVTAVATVNNVAAYGADAGATLVLPALAAGTASLTQQLLGNGDIIVNGAITGTVAALRRTGGSGTAQLNETCTYAGATTIDAGTLIVAKINALSGSGTTTVSGTGRLRTATGTTQRGRITMTGNLSTNGGTVRLGG